MFNHSNAYCCFAGIFGAFLMLTLLFVLLLVLLLTLPLALRLALRLAWFIKNEHNQNRMNRHSREMSFWNGWGESWNGTVERSPLKIILCLYRVEYCAMVRNGHVGRLGIYFERIDTITTRPWHISSFIFKRSSFLELKILDPKMFKN